MGKIVIKAELAEILGKTEQTLTTWQKQGLPIKVDGKRGRANQYDTSDVIDWLVRREIDAVLGDATGFNLEAEKARLAHHQANKAELEAEKLKGALIPVDDVTAAWCETIANFRARMLSIPSKASPQVATMGDAREVQGFLKGLIYEALAELAAVGVGSLDGVVEGISDGGAASDDDSQPVGGPVPKAVKRGKRRARAVADQSGAVSTSDP